MADYKGFAEHIVLGKTWHPSHMEDHGLQYRKNKNQTDLLNAVIRGIKNGFGKTEYEISSVAVQLQTVLKGYKAVI